MTKAPPGSVPAPPMASFNGEVAVLAGTNLGTHLAVPIHPDITAAELKRELESIHPNHFPEIGNIRVHGLMLKRRSCFYYLPESMPIKYAFQGLKGTWLLNIEAYPCASSEHKLPKRMAEEVRDHQSNAVGNFPTCSKRKHAKLKRNKEKIRRFSCLRFVVQELLRVAHLLKKSKRRKRLGETCALKDSIKGIRKRHFDRRENVYLLKKSKRRKQLVKACALKDVIKGLGKSHVDRTENVQAKTQNIFPVQEAPNETISETVSISAIINKYFPCEDEFASSSQGHPRPTMEESCFKSPIGRLPQYAERTLPTMVLTPVPTNASSGPSREKHRKTNVGKALVMASNSLGVSSSKRKPTISVCRYTEKKLSILKSSLLVRSLVYEISDEDE